MASFGGAEACLLCMPPGGAGPLAIVGDMAYRWGVFGSCFGWRSICKLVCYPGLFSEYFFANFPVLGESASSPSAGSFSQATRLAGLEMRF